MSDYAYHPKGHQPLDNPLFGARYTRATYCPYCGAKERHQIIQVRGAWYRLRCACGGTYQVRSLDAKKRHNNC